MTENERVAKLEERVASHERELCSIAGDIKEIKDQLLQRPSWAITMIITFLITFSSVLLTLILKK